MRLLVVLAFLAAPLNAAFALSPGDTLSDSASVGGYQVPLPPGSWTVVFAAEAGSTAYPAERAALVQLRGGVVSQMMHIRAGTVRAGLGYQAYPYCDHPDYFAAKVSANVAAGPQNCWQVQVQPMAAANPPQHVAAIGAYADRGNLTLSPAMVGARMHVANRQGMLRVGVYWAPELLLAPGEGDFWTAPDWRLPAVRSDVGKEAVMKVIESWTQRWAPRVEAAFAAGAQ